LPLASLKSVHGPSSQKLLLWEGHGATKGENMINIKKHQPGTPIVTEMELAGTTFEIELVPQTDKENWEVFKPFRKRKNIYNPVTKNMETQTYLDDADPEFAKIADDRLDKVVRNFRGIAVDDVELDGTRRENKLLLGSVQVEDTEDIEIEDAATGERAVIKQKRVRSFRQLIFEKAAQLGKATAEAATKNSLRSQPDTAEAGE